MLSCANASLDAVKSRVISLHLTLVTLAVFALYAYRDLWPLLTFTLQPLDQGEGSLLWSKIAIAGLVGVVEPLFEPFPYVPVDPRVRVMDTTLVGMFGH